MSTNEGRAKAKRVEDIKNTILNFHWEYYGLDHMNDVDPAYARGLAERIEEVARLEHRFARIETTIAQVQGQLRA